LEGLKLEYINLVEQEIDFADVKNVFTQKLDEAGFVIFELRMDGEIVNIC
jgi:hypothetical protein